MSVGKKLYKVRKNTQKWAKVRNFGQNMVFSRHNISRRKQAMTCLTLSQQRSKIELLYDESTYVLDDSISLQQI